MRNINPNEPAGGSAASPAHRQIRPVANATTPYWRTELHPIDEHRSTEELPEECDIAVIGAGMAGVSTAYHILEKAGTDTPPPSIVLLEARQVCSGATGRNGGHVKVKVPTLTSLAKNHGVKAAEEFAAFVSAQIYALKRTVEREGLECEFELRRSFDVFLDEEEAEAAKTEWLQGLGEERKWTRERDLVDSAFAEQVTSLKGAKVAISSPACSLWPYKFVTQLLARLLSRHPTLNLQTNTPVLSISHHDTTGHSTLHTPRGPLRARKLIFATNAYTPGISPTYVNTITPYKGTAVHIVPTNGPVAPHLSNTYNINYPCGPSKENRVDYLNPRPNGSIVVGGGKWTFEADRASWDNNWDDSTLLPAAMPHFEGLMQRHFRGWEGSGAVVDQVWTGVQGRTLDGVPHVGAVPGREGQYVLAGFNGGGMAMIFLCAEGVAEMVVRGVGFEETGVPGLFESTRARLEG